MKTEFGLLATVLFAALLALLVLLNVRGRRRTVGLAVRVAGNSGLQGRLHFGGIATMAVLTANAAAVVVASPTLTASNVGWNLADSGWAYALAAYALVALSIGNLRELDRLRSGSVSEVALRVGFLLPQTTALRWLAAGFAISVGISEEFVFRGLLIGAGTDLIGATVPAVLFSLAIFAWSHSYQGLRGMLGSAFLGLLLTGIYLLSGSLVLPILVHSAQDLMVFLLWPAGRVLAAAREGGPL